MMGHEEAEYHLKWNQPGREIGSDVEDVPVPPKRKVKNEKESQSNSK